MCSHFTIWRSWKQILIIEAHYFYDHHKKAASFLYEFLHEVERNNCANTHCSHGDTYKTPLYCIRNMSWYNMWPVVTGSHTCADAFILRYTLDVHASGTCVWPCYNMSHVVSQLTSNTTVELFIVSNNSIA